MPKKVTITLNGKEQKMISWLLLKGMEITNSDTKYQFFDGLRDKILNEAVRHKEPHKTCKRCNSTEIRRTPITYDCYECGGTWEQGD